MNNHPEFRYDANNDVVMVRCDITNLWWMVTEPEGAAYCTGCQEPLTIPVEAQRPQSPLPPLNLVAHDYEEVVAAEQVDILPCGHVSHENGGPADYGPECRQ